MKFSIFAVFAILTTNAQNCDLGDNVPKLTTATFDFKDDDPIIKKVPIVLTGNSPSDCKISQCYMVDKTMNDQTQQAVTSDYVKLFTVAGTNYFYYAQNYRPGYSLTFNIYCETNTPSGGNSAKFETGLVTLKQNSECGSALPQDINIAPLDYQGEGGSQSAKSFNFNPGECEDATCKIVFTANNQNHYSGSKIQNYDTYSAIILDAGSDQGYPEATLKVTCSSGRGANTYDFESNTFKVSQLKPCESSTLIKAIFKDHTGFDVKQQAATTAVKYKMTDFFDAPNSGCNTITACEVLDKDKNAIDITKTPYKDYMSLDDPPTEITFKQDYAPGYNLELLFKCTAGPDSNKVTATVHKSKTLDVKLEAKCKDSLSADDDLAFKGQFYKKDSGYVEASTIIDDTNTLKLSNSIGLSWSNTCPISDISTACSVNDIDDIKGDKVKLEGGKLMIYTEDKDGYTGKFSVTCTDEQQNKKTTNEFTVIQLSKCESAKYLELGTSQKGETLNHDDKTATTDITYTGIKTKDDDCKIKSCSMKKVLSDGSEIQYQTGWLSISVKEGLPTITMQNNVKDGYEETIRVSCEGQSSSDKITDSVNTIKFTQKAQCLNKLEKVAVSKQSFDYVEDGKATLTGFPIKSTDPTNCPIKSCKLLSQATQVTSVTKSEIKVSVGVKDTQGYTITPKFQCTGDGDHETLDSDPVTIVQSSQCKINLEKVNVNDKVINYLDSSDKVELSYGITVKDTQNCQITSCSVKKPDGSTDTNVVAGSDPTKILALQNVVGGYSEFYIVTCKVTNDLQELTNEIKVTQIHKCKGSGAISVKKQPESQSDLAWNAFNGQVKINHGVEGIDGCPVTCELVDAGTGLKKTPQNTVQDSDGNALVDTKTAWEGFSETFSFKCSNAQGEEVTTNSVTVSTKSKCFQMLTPYVGTQEFTTDYFATSDMKDLNIIPATTQDDTNCKINSCVLKTINANGIPESKVTDKLKLKKKDDGSYQVLAKQSDNGPTGYTYKFSLECTNDVKTVTTKTLTMTQNSNPCLVSMSVSPQNLTPWNMDYNLQDPLHTGTTKWIEQFPDSSGKCPNSVCKLFSGNCKDAADSRVSLNDKTDGYNLQMKQDEAEGYRADVCIECDNGDQKKTKTFSVQQQPRCIKRMTDKQSVTEKEAIMRFNDQTTMQTALPDVFSSFFENDNTDDKCQYTKCELKAKGCQDDWKETDLLNIKQNGANFDLMASIDDVYGYIREACISCTNGGNVGTPPNQKYYPRQTITYDNYKVQLPSRCNYAMTEQPNIQAIYIKEHDDDKVADPVLVKGYEEFFANADKVNCPVETCTLYNKGCNSKYSGTNLKMEATFPFKITIGDNVENGYTEDACIVCKNDWQIIKYDKIKIQQNGRCLQKLEKKMYTAPNLPLSYSATDENTVISEGWEDFFTNKDSYKNDHKCPITKCELLDKDCSTKWNLPGMSMESTYPYRIVASQQVIKGLKKDACVKCYNQHQSLTSPFMYSQLSKCVNQFSTIPYVMGKDEEHDVDSDGNKKQNRYEYIFDYNAETKQEYVGKPKPKTEDDHDHDHDHSDEEEGHNSNEEQTNQDETENNETTQDETENNETTQDETENNETTQDETENNETTQDETENNETNQDETNTNGDRRLEAVTAGAIFPLFFKNGDAVNCPHTKCTLMGPGCAFEYSSNNFVSMEDQAPWKIYAKTDVSEGYNTTICVKCSNMYQEIVQDNIFIVQKPSVPWHIIAPVIFAVVALLVCIVATCYGKSKAEKDAPPANTSETEIPSKGKGKDDDGRIELDGQNFQDEIQRKDDEDSDGAPESIRSGTFAADTGRPVTDE